MPAETDGGVWDPLPTMMSVLGDNPPPKPATRVEAAPGNGSIIPPPPIARAKPAEVTQEEQPVPPEAPPAKTGAPASMVPAGLIPGSQTPPAEPASEIPAVTPEPATPDEFPDEVERAGAKARSAWTGIKKENKEQAQKIKDYEQKLKDLEARVAQTDGTKPPEVQAVLELQKKVTEYEDRIGKLDITQSREFQTRFDLPIENSLKRGTAVLQRSGMSPEEAKSLMHQLVKADAQQAQELIADQPMPVQGALFNLTTEVAQMITDREDAIANWKQTSAAMSETAVREEEITLAQNIEKDTSEAIQQALKEGNFMYAQGPNMPQEWNAGVVQRVNAVKGILRMAKPAELVKWVAEGVVAKDLRAMLAQEHSRANSLAQELSLRTNMRPRLGGQPGPTSTKPASDTVVPVDPRDLAAKLFA